MIIKRREYWGHHAVLRPKGYQIFDRQGATELGALSTWTAWKNSETILINQESVMITESKF